MWRSISLAHSQRILFFFVAFLVYMYPFSSNFFRPIHSTNSIITDFVWLYGYDRSRPILLYVSLTSAWGNNRGATETESITWKDTGCAKSLLISYGIHRRRRFAFEVNGEYGSVQGCGWLLDSRRWRRRRNYHSLMSPIDTAIRRRTTVKYRQPSTSSTLDCIVLAQLIPVPYIVLYVRVF